MEITIRHIFAKDLTDQDIQVLADMLRELDVDLNGIVQSGIQLNYSVYDPAWYAAYLIEYRRSARENDVGLAGFSIALYQNIPIGYVFWTDSDNFQGGIQFNDIFVCPSWRCKGIGFGMMQETIRFIRTDLKITNFELEVFNNNLPALKLYEKLGFTKPIKTVLLLS